MDAPGRPFEAYSMDGQRILTGYARVYAWQASHDDHVYLIETGKDEQTQTVSRYRLVLEQLQ